MMNKTGLNKTGTRTLAVFLSVLTMFHLGSLWLHGHDGAHDGLGGMDAALSTTVMAVGVVLASAVLVRWLNGPLRRLVMAADRIGRGNRVAMPSEGPDEVRRLAAALDAMQERIDKLMQDRTEALAAVSHDLRTPLTRMRLRAGFLEDGDLQARMEADIAEMDAMIDATLAYFRGDASPETAELIDLGALLSTLCDAASDMGDAVTYVGPPHLNLRGRPVSLRRAASNLIENAVRYGGGARVGLVTESGTVTITVDDDGPGIPEADLGRVTEPFVRLDPARGSGGVGLGLAIVRDAAVEGSGALTLENRPEGGLRATLRLPR